MDDDRATEAATFVETTHQLNDSLTQARQGVEFYANLAGQNLQQLQSVNPATLQPEQQAQYYQQLNMATQQAQQQQGALENFRKFETDQREQVKKREAEMSSARLKASIPEWSNEHYAALGGVAEANGFSRDEFAEMTDYRFIKLLHKQWQADKATESVTKTFTQRKAKPPKSRSVTPSSRNAKGQFEKAKGEYTPGERGSFAKMKAAELRYKREGR